MLLECDFLRDLGLFGLQLTGAGILGHQNLGVDTVTRPVYLKSLHLRGWLHRCHYELLLSLGQGRGRLVARVMLLDCGYKYPLGGTFLVVFDLDWL